MDDEDNDKDYEMNMEKIMAKFSNFNSVLSQKSSATDDDDEDEDDDNKKEDEHEGKVEEIALELMNERDHEYAKETQPQIIVHLKEEEPLSKEYVD